jgi:CheY-like chemotaxis protein/nitrogen-specific signal transduction histidine kinase
MTFNVMSKKIIQINHEYCHMVLTDITELVESNKRLIKEKMKVEESETLKNSFLSNMSHEIRTPMNAIVGFTDIISNLITDPTLKSYMTIVVENTDYLLQLIDNIIAITGLDSDQIKVRETNFSLLDLLLDIQSKYIIKLNKINKNLKIEVSNKQNFIINSDRYLIEESLLRLIDNAVKFSEQGIIKIGFTVLNDNITIYVEDEGIGIENKYKEVIFDRFKKINILATGSGLGLPIVKSYIKLLKGDVNLISGDGKTKFYFTIPMYSETKLKEKFFKSSDTYKQLEYKKIMVVEDLQVNQMLIYDILKPYNVSVIQCFNGKEAIDKFNENSDIDLILMDLEMTGINGYEATEILRVKDQVVPIIAQTAHTKKENKERAKRIGFTDFISKPIIKDELLRIILKYI